MIDQKKKKLNILISFCSVNKIDNSNKEGKDEEKKKKECTEQVKT